MKKFILLIFIGTVATLLAVPVMTQAGSEKQNSKHFNDSIKDTIIDNVKTLTHWEKVIEAIIQVESKGDVNAKNGSCVGCMQITPIYVKQACIVSGKKLTLNMRNTRVGSIEIFNAMNDYYNPKHTLRGACKIHNSRGGEKYYLKVKKVYDSL